MQQIALYILVPCVVVLAVAGCSSETNAGKENSRSTPHDPKAPALTACVDRREYHSRVCALASDANLLESVLKRVMCWVPRGVGRGVGLGG